MAATYLDKIVARHRQLAAADSRPLDGLVEQARSMPAARGLRAALAGADRLAVISEIKRRSPSKGDLNVGLDPAAVAATYAAGGAACLSVLTDEEFFGGSITDLQTARAACPLPVLRKDFTVSAADVCDVRLMGADAVLLIVAALSSAEVIEFHRLAVDVGLDVLVEIHDERELEVALEVEADVLGLNNRDLTDFSVDLDRTFSLLADIPAGKTVVSESGVHSREQLDELERVGIDGVLVGETLMRAEDPEAALRALTGGADDTGELPAL